MCYETFKMVEEGHVTGRRKCGLKFIDLPQGDRYFGIFKYTLIIIDYCRLVVGYYFV